MNVNILNRIEELAASTQIGLDDSRSTPWKFFGGQPDIYNQPEKEKTTNSVRLLFISDWADEEDAELVCLLRNNAKELVELARKGLAS